MTFIRTISLWLHIVILISVGCATKKLAHDVETKMPPQALANNGVQEYINDDPFEKDEPSAECFENEQAIKEAYERLENARGSILAALFLPSFSFYTLKNIETDEKKMVFTENHLLPPPFDNEREWQIVKEDTVKIKTIVICVLILEIQKF